MNEQNASLETSRLCIVALLPEPETVTATLNCAAAVARGHGSRIEAVQVGFDLERGIVSAEELDIQQIREAFEGSAPERGARIRQAFDAWSRSAEPAVDVGWRTDLGEVEVRVAAEATAADLIVMARPSNLDARDALHAALFRSSRLVLIAPREAVGGVEAIGRRIVVGWKPTDQARHAVEAALPWLKTAESVTVVCVAKVGALSYEPSVRDLMSRLGIEADFVTLPRDARSVGVQLLAEAHRLGGDCLLIGAYHHGQLWEAVLGGVTRDVLHHLDLPIFMRR